MIYSIFSSIIGILIILISAFVVWAIIVNVFVWGGYILNKIEDFLNRKIF